MTIPFFRHASVAVFCLFPLAATAQSPSTTVQTLDDIVITASRSAEPLADASGDITIINAQQLADARGDSMADIIGRQPGVQFISNGGPQTIAGIFLRGANSNQTLVLVDGLRISELQSGGTHLETIDPALIERVEILRGAASSLYGSDAIGGVINIITKTGRHDRPLSVWANAGYGTSETLKTSAGLSGASHGWDYSLAGSIASSQGFDVMRGHFANNTSTDSWGHYTDKDGYYSHGWSGTLGYQWQPGHHIGLMAYSSYLHADSDGSQDDFPYATEDNVRNLVHQQVYAITSTNQITPIWESVLRFGWAQDALDYRRPTEGSFVHSSLKRSWSWQHNIQVHPDHRLSVLGEHVAERINSDFEYDENGRDINSLALIYKGRLDRLQAQASLRNDDYSDHGNQLTGGLGLNLDLTDAWQIGVAGSTGFRAPTFADLYQSGSMFYRGNPKLEPEKSRNIEAHLQYQDDSTQVRLTAYQNKIRDMIINVSDPITWMTSPENVNQATLRGLTLTGEHTLGSTTVRGSVDLLDPRNDDPGIGEGAQLQLRARQVFYAAVEHRIAAWKLGAEYQYTGNRYADAANRTTLGGYALVNLTAAYDFNKSLGMQVRWNNVLDKDYVRVDGYSTPGSNVFVNLAWRM
ncbi:TonB-dependent receptor plug domain-containing protein [Castellaniella sp.]|uniref:TonB-dependent receptor plug domain-containing protein n=1 Tax=Castellaniella sp. TaxID=1955812 RepID=UPI002AFF1799|nr:TonB-dependent receptor [Castellaniella sp.]